MANAMRIPSRRQESWDELPWRAVVRPARVPGEAYGQTKPDGSRELLLHGVLGRAVRGLLMRRRCLMRLKGLVH